MVDAKIKFDRHELAKKISASGLKKSELAKRINVANETLSRWLSGKTDSANKAKIELLNAILDRQLNISNVGIGGLESSQWKQDQLHSQVVCALDDELWISLLLTLCSSEKWLAHETSTNSEFSWFSQTIQGILCGSPVDETILPKNENNFEADAKSLFCHAAIHLVRRNPQKALAALNEAVLKAQSPWLVSSSYYLLALAHFLESRFDECTRLCAQALQLADECSTAFSSIIKTESMILSCHAFIGKEDYKPLKAMITRLEQTIQFSSYALAAPRLQAINIINNIAANQLQTIEAELGILKDYYTKLPSIFWHEFQHVVKIIETLDPSLALGPLYQDII